MKVGLLVALIVFAVHGVNGLLDGLNAWVELGLKFTGLAATAGGAWKWVVGPGWRKARSVVEWVARQLELIGELRDRLSAIEARLDQGHDHFERLDTAFESMTSEHAQEVRAAMHQDREVRLTMEGGAERRDRYGEMEPLGP